MQFMRYLYTLRNAYAVLLLSAVAVSQDAVSSWRSFLGVGAALGVGSVAAGAERAHYYAKIQPVMETM